VASKTSPATAAHLFAWRNAAKVPRPIAGWLANRAADVAWRRRGKGVRRLESNYAKVRPELTETEIRALSREGMRSYLRYFREAFTAQAATAEQLQYRVRIVGQEHVQDVIDGAASAVLAIGHMANWDVAGAWGSVNLAPVITVAERLNPPELFEQFLQFRESIGMEVLPLGEPDVFDRLVEAGRGTGGARVIALVADRDLTARGVEVNLAGHRARVAAGPATVALAAEIDLIPVVLYYERLTGERKQKAGTEWGVVMEVHAAVPVPEPDLALDEPERRRAQVTEMMQGWADVIGAGIQAHTADWHMLQRVFVEDLDPTRYADEPKRKDAASETTNREHG